MSYLYELPTTGAISFSEVCTDTSAEKLYISHISETTQSRANLRAILKESKRTQDGEKDYLKLVKVRQEVHDMAWPDISSKILDEYLPKLRGIMVCIANGQIELKSEPSRPALGAATLS